MQVRELQDPVSVYRQCMDLMTRLAAQGLVHCDFNEFNLLVGPPSVPPEPAACGKGLSM